MATNYTVTGPLVIAKNAEGGDLYVYQGGPVPEGQSEEWVKAHLEMKLITEGAQAADAESSATTSRRSRSEG